MQETLHNSRNFSLVKVERKKSGKRTGKFFYKIQANYTRRLIEEIYAVRAFVDPTSSRGDTDGYSWKFAKLADAKKKYTMMLLRWP